MAMKSGVDHGRGTPTKKAGTAKKASKATARGNKSGGSVAASMHVGSNPPSGIMC